MEKVQQLHRRSVSLLGIMALLVLVGCGGEDATPEAQRSAAADTPGRDAAAAQTDPNAFAPKAEIPARREGGSAAMTRLMLDAAVVPSRAEVGIPAYPGARIVQVQPADRMVLNDVEVDALPIIVLISEDEPSAVASFYRRELVGWKEGEFYLNQVFWDGDDAYDPLDSSGFVTPAVIVMEPIGDRADVFPGTRTEFQVRYRPGS